MPVIALLPAPFGWEEWEAWELFARRAIALRETRLEHALTEAALFEEIFFQPSQLLVQQIVCLVNQANGYVCDYIGRAGLNELPV